MNEDIQYNGLRYFTMIVVS